MPDWPLAHLPVPTDSAALCVAQACEFQPESKNNWLNLARPHQALGNGAGAAAAQAKAAGL